MKKSYLVSKYCCGCGLCNSLVNGRIDSKGFFRPSEDIGSSPNFNTSVCFSSSVGKNIGSQLWGNVLAAYYGYSNDANIRHNASSGGMLTEVACYLLSEKLVDCIIQIKGSIENQIETVVTYSTSVRDVKLNCGSRYTASASLLNLLDNIETDKRYAIIGKPCDIRVLRNYCEQNKKMQNNIPYFISFFCAGTPSRQANISLLNKLGTSEKNTKSLTYRGNGWPGKTICEMLDGTVNSMEYEDSWGKILGRDIQDICRFCWEGTAEAADISCGDGWYIVNGKPDFAENAGRNIILARTEIGKDILESMGKQNTISLESITDLGILDKMQPGQFMRKTSMFSRVLAMRLFFRPVPSYRMADLYKYSKLISKKQNLKLFAGTVKRILQGKM